MDRDRAAEIQKHLLEASDALDRATEAMSRLDKDEREAFSEILFEVHDALHFGLLRAITSEHPELMPAAERPHISTTLRWEEVLSSGADLVEIFDLARRIKAQPSAYRGALRGRTLAMIFQKPSTRTRVSFEAGMYQLGGHALNLGASDIQLRRGETVAAVSSICSHLPCELSWNGSGGLLNCSCHPASFTPDGQSTNVKYPLPALNEVQVRVTSAGRVEVLGTA